MGNLYLPVPAENIPSKEEIEKCSKFYINSAITTLNYILRTHKYVPVAVAAKLGERLAHEAFKMRRDLRVAQ